MAYETLKELAQLYRKVKADPETRGIRLEYGVMMCVAAAQCMALGAAAMTVLEFGVYRGDGLLALADFCHQIADRTGLSFRLLGFDSGVGMPAPRDFRDHPEIWRTGDFQDVNYDRLASQLPSFGSLRIGDFGRTVPEFRRHEMKEAAPIGFVSIDSDLYTSATAALQIFEEQAKYYLPTTMVYFDDVDDIITFNQRCGEALAIVEFNEKHRLRFIERKRSDLHGYYSCHVLDHPVRSGTGSHGTFDIRVSQF